MGVLTLGATCGTVTGIIAGGLLADAFGWRMAFVLMGVPGLLIGALIFFTLREPPRGRYAPPGARIAQDPVRTTLASLVGNRVFIGLVAGFAVQIMIGYAMAFWMAPIALRRFELPVRDVALYLGLAFLVGGIPGPLLGGFLTDRLIRRDERWRAWFPGIVSLLAIAPLALALQANTFPVFLALFALSYGIFVSSQPPILSGIQAAVEPNQRGMAVAFALFFNNLLGQALGLGVIGVLSDMFAPRFGMSGLAQSVLAVSLLAGIGALMLFAWTARQMSRAAR